MITIMVGTDAMYLGHFTSAGSSHDAHDLHDLHDLHFNSWRPEGNRYYIYCAGRQ